MNDTNTGLGREPVKPLGANLSFLSNGPGGRPAQSTPPPVAESRPEQSKPEKEEEITQVKEHVREVKADSRAEAQPVVVYIPIRTRERLKAYCGRTGRTYTDVVLDAVEELDSQLSEVFAQQVGVRSPGGLFSRRTTRRPRTGEPGVQIPLRLSPEDLEVLDERVTEYAEGNRSLFIRAVLDSYLTGHEQN